MLSWGVATPARWMPETEETSGSAAQAGLLAVAASAGCEPVGAGGGVGWAVPAEK